MRNLIPWDFGKGRNPGLVHDAPNALVALHREMNRLIDETFRGIDTPVPFGSLLNWPTVELVETDGELRVSAELPGLDDDDVEVLLSDGVLTLRGEKKSEIADEQRQFSERIYGRFERQIRLGTEVEEDKATASFENGVLTVTLPKTEKAKPRTRRIAINGRA